MKQKLPLDGGHIWPVLTQRAKSPHFDEVAPSVDDMRGGNQKPKMKKQGAGEE